VQIALKDTALTVGAVWVPTLLAVTLAWLWRRIILTVTFWAVAAGFIGGMAAEVGMGWLPLSRHVRGARPVYVSVLAIVLISYHEHPFIRPTLYALNWLFRELKKRRANAE
jgi:hypothetical protein